MIPPLMSSTLNMEDLKGRKDKTPASQNQNTKEEGKSGRPEKPDDEKSDKTLANKESMG